MTLRPSIADNPDPADNQPAPPEAARLAELHRRLLTWFAATGRDLPWRKTRDPYQILVSEMMLQQTQVDRVLPKYAAFLDAFPTFEALAAAPTAEVIRQWAGLGYNRRAVNLQRIARTVLAEHAGTFPHDVATLRKLPGIGPYTAGALACFAFEQDVAFMDTNIRRVIRRLLVGPEDAPPATSERVLLELAQAVVPGGQGWAWNQAVMELGALICTANNPACWRCPVRQQCRAYAAWRQADATVSLADDATAEVGGEGSYQTSFIPRPVQRVAERPAQPFTGSNRYYRGRVIDQLRALPHGGRMQLMYLGALIKDDFAPDTDEAWLRKLVAGLARDGLVAVEGEAVGLPG